MCVYVTAMFTTCESTEQRICINVCFKIEKTASETYRLLQQTYGEDAKCRTHVFDWFRPFKEGRTSAESDLRSVQQSTSGNEEMILKVRTIFRNNGSLTLQEIAEYCGISVGSSDANLTDDLHMKRVCAKFGRIC
jgi:hypothetical protein